MTFSDLELAAIQRYCQDVDALSLSWRKARRFTFTLPQVDDYVIVVDELNPALVKVITSEGDTCTGRIYATLNTKTIQVGDEITGFFNGETIEWRYDNKEELKLLDDYRQCIVDMAKSTPWWRRYSRLPLRIKANNASTNLFLQDVAGISPLRYECDLNTFLTKEKKRGETALFATLLAQVLFLLAGASFHASVIAMLLNGLCTLYSLYVWYNDVRAQRTIQEKFDRLWSAHKKEYHKLSGMIARYGLSDNRIKALRQWYAGAFKVLESSVPYASHTLGGAWFLRLLNQVNLLDMEDNPDKHDAQLATLFNQTEAYIADLDKFQKKHYDE